MSGTPSQATGPLTDAERVATRRFCGFPAFGSRADGNAGWRFFAQYGHLEYRMTNMADAELSVLRGFLARCAELESAILGASENLDTDQAAVWKRNSREVSDRTALYRQWRRELCAFLGIQPGPGLGDGSGARIIV